MLPPVNVNPQGGGHPSYQGADGGLSPESTMVFKRLYRKIYDQIALIYWIFFHNEFTTRSTILDTLIEPVLWFAEKLAKKAGPIFVFLVMVLTSSIVLVYYIYITPYKAQKHDTGWALFDLVLGHWLLLNIVFHYYKGVTTSPGKPPARVDNPVSVCKNCISPKPPRTHHCGLCRKCILKMDHHCPWLNNCVGHYNHRYFYLFCVYMCSGTIFVCITTYDQFREYFYSGESQTSYIASLLSPAYLIFSWHRAATEQDVELELESPTSSSAQIDNREKFWVLYEFLLCAGVTVALGLLTLWHGYLISRGETSIERHINKRERLRLQELGAEYRNPYHFGFLNNWKIFLGIEQGTRRSFWRHVLLPSAHNPEGDGNIWRTYRHKDR